MATEKKITKEKPKVLDINQICNLIKANSNTRKYIEFKYSGKEMTEVEWKNSLKKDGLSF